MYECAYVHVCVFRSMCTYVHIHVEARGQHVTCFLTCMELTKEARIIACKSWDSSCPLPQRCDYKYAS